MDLYGMQNCINGLKQDWVNKPLHNVLPVIEQLNNLAEASYVIHHVNMGEIKTEDRKVRKQFKQMAESCRPVSLTCFMLQP